MKQLDLNYGFGERQKFNAVDKPESSDSLIFQPRYTLAAWLTLIGAVIPTALSFYIGGARFTPGRTAILLLFPWAVIIFRRGGRRIILSDVFVTATAVWMVLASIQINASSSALAEALEFFASYVTARAFFFWPQNIKIFLRTLGFIVTLVVVVGFMDFSLQRYAVQEMATAFVNLPAPIPIIRNGLTRATSTFDHPIHFGVFCCFAASILISLERHRAFYVFVCMLGIIFSVSSSAILGAVIVVVVRVYDKLMGRILWRWKLLMLLLFGLFVGVFLVSNNPLGWFIGHMTIEPDTAYWRELIWQQAISKIELSPVFGFSFDMLNDWVLDNSVDSVWLVYALRFGLPMIVLLALTNVSTFLFNGPSHAFVSEPAMNNVRAAFTVALVMFMLLGFTVHFWNFLWIFWGLCIGIRGSLRELSTSYWR